MRRKLVGFTLIELMITVAIVGILAAVAVPAYTGYVQSANRSAAQQFMMEVSSRAEEYRLDAGQYPTAIGSGTGELDISVPSDVSNYYSVSLSASNSATPPTYTVTATPKSGTMQENESTLTLNSAGVKTPSDEW